MPGLISPIGIGTALAYPKQATAGAPLDPLVLPGDTNPPILFEPPPGLTAGDLETWIIATGGAQWGGCQLWISLDGSTYAYAGTIYRGGRQGVLTAALPSDADPDTANTLSVDLAQSRGQLLSGSLADADAFVTLCYCDGELVAFETATLTSAFHYNLTYLRRGVYGTPVGAHSAGASFARFGPNDPSLFKYIYPASFIGQTIHVKLASFNIFGQALQGLAGLTPTSYSLTGDGAIQGPAYVSGSWPGSPAASQIIERYIFATAVTSFTIAKNGSAMGTMQFAAGISSASFAMASATTFAAGDVLTIAAPATPDATLANLAWTLAGAL